MMRRGNSGGLRFGARRPRQSDSVRSVDSLGTLAGVRNAATRAHAVERAPRGSRRSLILAALPVKPRK